MARVTRRDGGWRHEAREAEALRLRLGRALQRLRTEAGLSQEAFADAAGVHRTYAGKVERGEINLSIASLQRLARPLGMHAGELLLKAEREPL